MLRINFFILVLMGLVGVLEIGSCKKHTGDSEHYGDAPTTTSDAFNEMKQRNDQFLKTVRNSPVVEVYGVVDASGAGGASTGNDDWTLCFHLNWWHTL